MFVLGGAALVVKFTPWAQQVQSSLDTRPILMPLLVCSVAALGLLWQHQRYGLIGNDGAPIGGRAAAKAAAEKKAEK